MSENPRSSVRISTLVARYGNGHGRNRSVTTA